MAGCFNSVYYDTLFMWWGPSADEDLKTFILQHEMSHFIQWWDYYDTMRGGFSSGLFDDEDVRLDVMESDATCRVIEQWGIPAPTSDISVPCTASDWHDEWFIEEMRARS